MKNADIKNQEADIELKQAENDLETVAKQHEEAVKQNAVMNSRADAQSASMKQLEGKLANYDMEESELLNQFADYMVEASARFEAFSVCLKKLSYMI